MDSRRGEEDVRVLVVEDEPATVRLLRLILADAGFEVFSEPEGRSALHAVEERHPDAIVLDLNLPVMDGATFFERLRSQGDRTPVLILSAEPDARREQRRLGAEAVLQKPFDPDELVRRVDQLVKREVGGAR